MTADKRLELETFWRSHLDGWRRSELNQREYCELHGLPLKRFGNWRAQFQDDDVGRPPKLLYRRGAGLKHMSKHMLNRETVLPPRSYIPSAKSVPAGARRCFSPADKRRIVGEASRPGASVSDIARRYGISKRLLFHWKQELAPAVAPETTFLSVIIADTPSAAAVIAAPVPAPPIVVERPPGIEVELAGGRRVRFDRDVDPETIQRLVALLEEQHP
ncbi:MAG: transposase [Sphingomonadales bacterium]